MKESYHPAAAERGGGSEGWRSLPIATFLWERTAHLLEARGLQPDAIRAVGAVQSTWSDISDAVKRVEALSVERSSVDFQALATLFKRVKNITKGIEDTGIELSQ